MPSLRQCKKLIAEQERGEFRPTISHWRDKENGMKRIANSLESYAYQPQMFNETVKYTVRYIRKDLANKDRIAGFSTLTKAREYADKIRRDYKGKYSNIRITEYRVKKNPTVKTAVSVPNPLTGYGERIKKLPAGSSLKSELTRIYNELKTVTRESKGKNANKDYYRPRIAALKSALTQGLRAAKNPTVKKTVVTKRVTTIKKTNPKRRINATHSDFKRHQKLQIEQLAKMFQGVANGDSVRLLEPDTAPPNKFRLGYLAQVKFKRNGTTIPLNFDGQSLLSADTKTNLWIVGKDSIIENGSLRQLGIKKPTGNGLEYVGDLFQIDYVTAKRHIENGETVRFFHKLGEADGIRPRLYVDKDGFPIIHGGNYQIWDVGIVN